jgi:hypothetical protein
MESADFKVRRAVRQLNWDGPAEKINCDSEIFLKTSF